MTYNVMAGWNNPQQQPLFGKQTDSWYPSSTNSTTALINGVAANTGVGVGGSAPLGTEGYGAGFEQMLYGDSGARPGSGFSGVSRGNIPSTGSNFWGGALDWGKTNALDIAGLGMQGFSLYQGMKAGKQAQKNFQQQMALAKENQKFTYADALSRYENRAAQRLVNDGVSGVDAVRQAEAGSRAKLRDHYGVNPVA